MVRSGDSEPREATGAAAPGGSRLDPREDLDRLRAARDGDARAAQELLQTHAAGMVRTAWRVLGRYGERDADDVVQEALIAALTTSALPHGDVGRWLRSITARKALDHVRAARRRAEDHLPPESDTAFCHGGEAQRVDVLAARRALATLSPRDRALLTLVDLEGFSLPEAAQLLGSTHVAARLRAVRARRRLARILEGGRG